MHAVLQHARGAHKRVVLEATAPLAGTHAAWQPILQSHGGGTVRSTLTAEQLAGALSMGLIRPTAGRPRITAALFAIPKSDGTTARPIYDARRQNALIDWSAVRTSLRHSGPRARGPCSGRCYARAHGGGRAQLFPVLSLGG